eukprot:PhM_4_TR8232/c0_g1_i1/m.60357
MSENRRAVVTIPHNSRTMLNPYTFVSLVRTGNTDLIREYGGAVPPSTSPHSDVYSDNTAMPVGATTANSATVPSSNNSSFNHRTFMDQHRPTPLSGVPSDDGESQHLMRTIDQVLDWMPWGKYHTYHLMFTVFCSALFSMNVLSLFFMTLPLEHTTMTRVRHDTTISTAMINSTTSPTRNDNSTEDCSWGLSDCRALHPDTSAAYYLAVTLNFLGLFLGSAVSRFLTLRLGCRIPHFAAFALLSVLFLIRIFSGSLLLFQIYTFLIGLAIGVTNVSNQLMETEYFAMRRLPTVSIACLTAFSVGYLLLVVIAAPLHANSSSNTWYVLSLVLCVLNGATLLGLRFIVESPKWCESRKSVESAVEQIERMAAMSGVTLPEGPIIASSAMCHTVRRTAHFHLFQKEVREIASNREMKRTTVVIMFCFFTLSLVYYGLAYSAQLHDQNPFLMSAIFAFQDIPAYFLAIRWSSDFPGPRNTTVVLLSLAGICLYAQAHFLSFICTILTYFAVTTCLTSMYIFCINVCPVTVKTWMLRFASISMGLGATMIGPTRWISYTVGSPIVHNLVWGSMCLICAFALSVFVHDIHVDPVDNSQLSGTARQRRSTSGRSSVNPQIYLSHEELSSLTGEHDQHHTTNHNDQSSNNHLVVPAAIRPPVGGSSGHGSPRASSDGNTPLGRESTAEGEGEFTPDVSPRMLPSTRRNTLAPAPLDPSLVPSNTAPPQASPPQQQEGGSLRRLIGTIGNATASMSPRARAAMRDVIAGLSPRSAAQRIRDTADGDSATQDVVETNGDDNVNDGASPLRCIVLDDDNDDNEHSTEDNFSNSFGGSGGLTFHPTYEEHLDQDDIDMLALAGAHVGHSPQRNNRSST